MKKEIKRIDIPNVKKANPKVKTGRIARWRPTIPDPKGIKYPNYIPVHIADLDRWYKEHLNDANKVGIDFTQTQAAPLYANLVLYVLVKQLNEWLDMKGPRSKDGYKLTLNAIRERMTELFGKYGFKITQSAVFKALKSLETPFCYGIPTNGVFNVVSAKRARIREREDRNLYWFAPLVDELENKACRLRSEYLSKVVIPFPYVINQYYRKSGVEVGWINSGILYRFKDNNNAKSFKEALLKTFGEQGFYNIIIYEDNVAILLAQDYPKFTTLSDILSNLFTDDRFLKNITD